MDIDNNVLIAEVENRPALFDKTLHDYGNLGLKAKLWEEVFETLFPTTWGALSTEEKAEAGKSVQARWKNLRACFSRELREQKLTKAGQSNKKRRKYIYFDQLNFLQHHLESRESSETAVSEEENEETKQISRPPLPPKVKNGVKRKTPEQSPPYFKKTVKNHDIENPEQSPPYITKTGKNLDAEEHFLLSLVPMLKALPRQQKIDVQIQILQVFRENQPSTEMGSYFASSSRQFVPQQSSHTNIDNLTYDDNNSMSFLPQIFADPNSPQDCASVHSKDSDVKIEITGANIND